MNELSGTVHHVILCILRFNDTIAYIDHFNAEELVVQYFNNPVLYKFMLEEEKQVEVARLPVSVVRFGGWLHNVSRVGGMMVKAKIKKFWYGVS